MKIRSIAALLTLFGILFLLRVEAQSKLSIDNVYKAYLRNSGAIISNEEIKGYYLFYQSDKVDRKTNEYTLQILDENLVKVKDIKFTDSKNVTLQEAAFNGKDLLFVFFDADEKELDYRSYGIDGTQKFSYSHPLDKKTINYMKTSHGPINSEESQNNTLFSVENKGFIALIPIKDGGEYTYEVSYYQTDRRSQWAYSPDDDAKYSFTTYIGSSDSVAVFQVLRKESLFSSKIHTMLLGLTLDKGRKAFEFEAIKDQHLFYPMNIGSIDGSNNFLLLGPYYQPDDNVLKDNSLGLGIWVMNNQGQLIKAQYSSWEKDLSKFLSVNANGKVDDLGYIYFHHLVQTNDGKYFAIGEGYKKVASALGIGLKALGGNASAFKLRITNMVLLQFDKDFKITDSKIYEKNDNIFILPSGYDLVGPHLMAVMAKNYGYFDYKYTQTDKIHSTFVVGYSDYVKSSDYKGGTFNTISYYNNKITTDKINLKSDASDVHVLPSKTGSIVVLEYFKKDKKLEIRIEKVN